MIVTAGCLLLTFASKHLIPIVLCLVKFMISFLISLANNLCFFDACLRTFLCSVFCLSSLSNSSYVIKKFFFLFFAMWLILQDLMYLLQSFLVLFSFSLHIWRIFLENININSEVCCRRAIGMELLNWTFSKTYFYGLFSSVSFSLLTNLI